MQPKQIKRRLRTLVRDYVMETMDEFPGADQEKVIAIVHSRLRDDYSEARWLDLMLRIAEILIPILFVLMDREVEGTENDD